MQFKIRNFMRVSSADISTSKLTFIGGKHANGKSSSLDAIRCLITGNANPFKEITKKQSSMFVYSGTPSGSIKMINGENEECIEYPSQDIKTTGAVDAISDFSAGIKSFIDLTLPDRIQYLSELLKAAPKEIDLIDELKKQKIFPKDTTIGTNKNFIALWDQINMNGWDNTYKSVKEKGAILKGKWQQITGREKYGVKIAESYKPEKYTHDLETVKIEVLQTELNKQKEWYENALKAGAVEESEKEALVALVCTTTEVEKEILDLRNEGKKLEEKRIALVEKSRKSEDRNLLCPHCQNPVTYTNGKLLMRPVEEKTTETKTDNIDTIKKQINENLINFGEKRAELKKIEAAQKTLNEMVDTPEDNETDGLETITIAYERAKDRIEAFNQYAAGKKAHSNIAMNKKMQSILKPDGLRAKKLKKALDEINGYLKKLSDHAGWKPVEINENGIVSYGGVQFGRFLAKSERYRSHVLCQYMIGHFEKSCLLIVDDSDELTGDIRNGLIKMILKSGINTIIACALKSKEELPDLSKFGGKSYWIEDGHITCMKYMKG